MRSLRSGLLAALLLATVAVATAAAAARPQLFQSGRYAAAGPSGVAQLRRRAHADHEAAGAHAAQLPEHAARTGTARRRSPSAPPGRQRPTTYSRIYLPADGATNISFVADDNARQPEIYLSLQIHGEIGHVSVHARSEAQRETCAGALGFDVRVG